MREVLLFDMVSLDGLYEGPGGDLGWHVVDEEFNEFAIRQLDSVEALLFGRITYEMMAAYWPTPQAIEDDPVVARKMNALPKVVFSRTLAEAGWQNTRLVKTDAAEEVARLKGEPGRDLILFGSSNLAASLLPHGLIDELRIMVNPLVLGSGRSLFAGLQVPVRLIRVEAREFRSGNVLLTYRPEAGRGSV